MLSIMRKLYLTVSLLVFGCWWESGCLSWALVSPVSFSVAIETFSVLVLFSTIIFWLAMHVTGGCSCCSFTSKCFLWICCARTTKKIRRCSFGIWTSMIRTCSIRLSNFFSPFYFGTIFRLSQFLSHHLYFLLLGRACILRTSRTYPLCR